MDLTRSLEFLVSDIKEALAGGRPCTLLIGAGCSVTAGIPAAAGFVEQIKERHFHRYELATNKTYAECMAQLDPSPRQRLIEEKIDGATINLAHLAIASLVSHRCVDRILTTNFDPLVVRACALLNEFPAVYDCAASDGISPRQIGGQAVFYLHGQYRGPILINTPKDLERNAARVRPVIGEALEREGILIVVGYSGESDPVFDALAEPGEFREPVFWVSYEDNPPPRHVSERLLVEGKGAHQIEGYDADSFFVALAQELNAFPPELLRSPFSHLATCLDPLPRECRLPGQDDPIPIGADARGWVQQAVRLFEAGDLATLDSIRDTLEPERRVAEAEALLLSGRYEDLAALRQRYEGEPPRRLADVFARGYFKWGLALHTRGKKAEGGEAEQILSQACDKYEAALAIKPDYHWALGNWGNTLLAQAKTKEGAEADALLAQAVGKYQATLKIKPDSHEALNNWGLALAAQAKTREGAEAEAIFAQAVGKYQAALKIKPDLHEALNNWGNALSAQAKTKEGAEADALLSEAVARYQAALEINPDRHEALYNWGLALAAQAKTREGAEAEAIFAQAVGKYQTALKIKPDLHEALNNWGIALLAQARTKEGGEADALFAQAGEKYEAALRIKPDFHQALNNWGSALLLHGAMPHTGERSAEMFALAKEKALAAERIKPGAGAYNAACAFGRLGEEDECRRWLKTALEHGELPKRSHLEQDEDLYSVREKDWFRGILEAAPQ